MRPVRNRDLHGSVPDQSPAVLVLIDVINDMEFEDGARLLEHALPAARRIAALKARARASGIPAVYANDNFGRWQSDFTKLLDRCLHEPVRGRPVARLLAPAADDYFVLKPKHSAFFSTTLETLLAYLGAETLILVGFTADICVLFSAADGYMRNYRLYVPADCVASVDPGENARALALMERVLKADVAPSADLALDTLTAPRAA